jgi:hypothetical protein
MGIPAKTTINLKIFAQTDIGRTRGGNEDNFLVFDLSSGKYWVAHEEGPQDLLTYAQGHYGSLLAVADGEGGEVVGKAASRLAVETVRDRLLNNWLMPGKSRKRKPKLTAIAMCSCRCWADIPQFSLPCLRFEINRDVAPLSLIEANHAQRASGNVTDQNCDPDVNRVQPARLLNHQTNAKRHNDLRHD